jgi:asparagine synthase (glutamine-hydrolysing)
MSGIVGIWNLDGRPASSSLLASLSRQLAHRGSDNDNQWCHGPAGLACRLLRVTPESLTETQPTIGPSGTVLVFDGRLDNRAELLATMNNTRDVTAKSPDPVLVLAAYDRFGDRVAEHLNGDFAFGLFDPEQRRLLLARDALGIRPLYYTRTRNTFLFSSEIKALLAHPDVHAVPNDDMLACYLVSSAPKDTSMTCFKDIASLLPAHCMVVTPERISTRQYWDFSVTEQRFDSFRDYAHAFRHLFTQAVRRRMRSAFPVAVSVSGGLDSSSILCMADTLRRTSHEPAPPVIGMSYLSPAGSPSDEKEFLVEIERQYPLAIERIPIVNFGLMDGCYDAVWHVEAPFLDHQWNTAQTFYRHAQTRGVRVMLTGHWADQVLFPQAYLVDLFRQLRWRDIGAHLNGFEHWMPDIAPGLFRKRFWLDLARHHVPKRTLPYLRWLRASPPPAWYSDTFCRKAFQHLLHRPIPETRLPTAHARCLYEEARSPYHVQCMEWNNKVANMYGMEMAFPFLDRDLICFLMSIPGDVQTQDGVPKALLREGLRGILPDAIANRKWKADFTHLVNEGMERDFHGMLDCMQSGSAAINRGYVKRNALQEHLRRLQGQIREARTGELTWALTDLLGLELWLQVFFEPRGIRNESGAEELLPKQSTQEALHEIPEAPIIG